MILSTFCVFCLLLVKCDIPLKRVYFSLWTLTGTVRYTLNGKKVSKSPGNTKTKIVVDSYNLNKKIPWYDVYV